MRIKKSVFILATLFSIVLVATLVAAQDFPAVTPVLQDLSGFFSSILIGSSGAAADIFLRIMIVVLLTAVLYLPAEKIAGGNTSIGLLIALIVSIIGVRFISKELLEGVLALPYGILAITITVFLPFALFALLMSMESLPLWLRKVGWSLYGTSFIAIALFGEAVAPRFAWVYLGSGIAAFAYTFFVEDKIKSWYIGTQLKEGRRVAIYSLMEETQRQMKEAYKKAAEAETTAVEEQQLAIAKRLNKKVRRLSRLT